MSLWEPGLRRVPAWPLEQAWRPESATLILPREACRDVRREPAWPSEQAWRREPATVILPWEARRDVRRAMVHPGDQLAARQACCPELASWPVQALRSVPQA